MIKKRKHYAAIILGVIAAAVILLAVIALSVRLTEITVAGNSQYTAEQITSLLFKNQWDRNTVYSLYKDRFKAHEQLPFVEDYKFVFQSPTKLEVIVYEKSVVGYVSYMSSFMYFDKDGIIVESSSEKLPGIPLITGLNFGHIVLHQPLPVENQQIFEQILNLTQLLSMNEIAVDKIAYASDNTAMLMIGELEIYLGSNDQMNGKIAELKDQLSVLTGLSGELYLDTYNEANPLVAYRFLPSKYQ